MQETRWDQSSSAAVVLEKNGRFFAYQPGLALISSADTVEAAYRKFSEARRSFLEDAKQAGLGVDSAAVAPPAKHERLVVSRDGLAAELGLFLAKTCIVLLVVGGLGAVAAAAAIRAAGSLTGSLAPEIARATSGASEFFKSFSSISMVDIANKAAVIVQDVQAMPEYRKESLRQSVGILSREAAPIVEAWRNPPPLPDSKSAPTSQPKQ